MQNQNQKRCPFTPPSPSSALNTCLSLLMLLIKVSPFFFFFGLSLLQAKGAKLKNGQLELIVGAILTLSLRGCSLVASAQLDIHFLFLFFENQWI